MLAITASNRAVKINTPKNKNDPKLKGTKSTKCTVYVVLVHA